MQQQKKQRKCYLYVLNTLADWEIGFITAELQSGRYTSKELKFDLITLGNTKETIRTMGGISITPEKTIEEIELKEGDALILPGADTWMEDANSRILGMIPVLLEKKVIVAAICGATIALAQTGLLNNRKHTSNAKEYLEMVCTEYRGSSLYTDEPVVVDGNLITATGLAPLEFSYEVFKRIDAMNEDSLESWYQLYRTKEPKYFFSLMESLK